MVLSISLVIAALMAATPLLLVGAASGHSSGTLLASGEPHLNAAFKRGAAGATAPYVSHSWPPLGQHPDLLRIVAVLQHPYDAVVVAPLFRLMSAFPRQLYGAAIVVESPGNNISIKTALKDLRIRDFVAINMDYIRYDTSVQAEVTHHLYHHFLAMTAAPHAVIVVGNSVSALAGATVAQALDIPVFYIAHPAPPASTTQQHVRTDYDYPSSSSFQQQTTGQASESISGYDADSYRRSIIPHARMVFCATSSCFDDAIAGGVRQAARVVVTGSPLLDTLGSLSYTTKQLAAAQSLLGSAMAASAFSPSSSSSTASAVMPPSNYVAIACSQSCSDAAVRGGVDSVKNPFLDAVMRLTETHKDRTFVLFLDAFYNAHPGAAAEDGARTTHSKDTIRSILKGRRSNVIVVGHVADYALYTKLLLAADTIIAESDFGDGYLEVESLFMNIPLVHVGPASWRPGVISSPARLMRVHYDAARIVEAASVCLSGAREAASLSPLVGHYGDGQAAQRILWHISTALNPEPQHDCCESITSIDLRNALDKGSTADANEEEEEEGKSSGPSVSVFVQSNADNVASGVLQRQLKALLSQTEAASIRHIVVVFDAVSTQSHSELRSSMVDGALCEAAAGSVIECKDASRSVHVKVTSVTPHGGSLFIAPAIAPYAITEGIDFVLFVSAEWIPHPHFLSASLAVATTQSAVIGPVGLTLARNATYLFADSPPTSFIGALHMEVDFLMYGWLIQTRWLPSVASVVLSAQLETLGAKSPEQLAFVLSAQLWLKLGVRSVAVLSPEQNGFAFPRHRSSSGSVQAVPVSMDGEPVASTTRQSSDILNAIAASGGHRDVNRLLERRWIEGLGYVPCGLRQLRAPFPGLRCCARMQPDNAKAAAVCTNTYRSLFSGANSLAAVSSAEEFLLPRNVYL